VAAYQSGRLLNQLNWHCQLAVLISRDEQRQAIGVLVTKLKSVSQELVQDAPSPVEKRIDRFINRFWKELSSYSTVEYHERLVEEIERSDSLPDDYGLPEMTCERACANHYDLLVEPIVAAIRKILKKDFDSSERWAFWLGEYVDGGVRRGDVYAFVNRQPPIQVVEYVACDEDVQSAADGEEEEAGYCKKEEGKQAGEQVSAETNDAGRTALDLGSVVAGEQSSENKSDEEQPAFDGCVKRDIANYHPVPGSVLPEPAWDQQVLEFARRVGIEKALSMRISPVPLEATCEDVIRVVALADECAYIALCKLKKPWCHPVDELRPLKFRFGPLKGQKHWLSKLLGHSDVRGIETPARNGTIWVSMLGRTEYEVHFANQARFDAAVKNAAEDAKEAPSATDSSLE
jgi:hypothetical protein